MRTQRTAKELEGMAEHVGYEIQLLRWAVGRLSQGPERILVNVAIECFLLHLRNLRDFFYAANPRDDDAVASDYFDDPTTWESSRPELASVIAVEKERIHRALVHLSYSRLGYVGDAKGWKVGEMTAAIDKTFMAFLQKLPTEREAWFKRFV